MKNHPLRLQLVLLTFFLLSVWQTTTAKEIIVFTPNAWQEFARGYPDKNVEDWLARKGHQYIVYSKPWKPARGQQHWLYYRYLDLRVWFITSPSRQLSDYNAFKNELMSLSKVRNAPYKVSIRKVTFEEGITIMPVDVLYEIGERANHQEEQQNWKEQQQDELSTLEDRILAATVHPESDANYFEEQKGKLEDWHFGMPLGELGDEIQKIRDRHGIKGRKFNPSGGNEGTGQQSNTGQPNRQGQSGNDSAKGDKTNGQDDGSMNGEKGGKSNKGGGGIGGKLPIKVKFSKWFQVLVQEVLTYFKIKELSEKILFVAYLVAPDLVE